MDRCLGGVRLVLYQGKCNTICNQNQNPNFIHDKPLLKSQLARIHATFLLAVCTFYVLFYLFRYHESQQCMRILFYCKILNWSKIIFNMFLSLVIKVMYVDDPFISNNNPSVFLMLTQLSMKSVCLRL